MANDTEHSKKDHFRKPEWLRIKLPSSGDYAFLKDHLSRHNLHTICESGNCPNLGECWSRGTATFMLLGDVCTRSCTFCNIKVGKPLYYDLDEPRRIAVTCARPIIVQPFEDSFRIPTEKLVMSREHGNLSWKGGLS